MELTLVTPDLARLPAFVAALERGWSPDNVRGEAAIKEALSLIARHPAAFLARADDPEGRAGDIALPDGTRARRLPGLQRWLWDGEFCGVIGFRWQDGTPELPPHVLGHMGYAVPPWKQGRGYATRALKLLLPVARGKGLPWIELTTEPDNIPSQKVILSNGGRLLGRFAKPEAYGGGELLRWRIDLDSGAEERQ